MALTRFGGYADVVTVPTEQVFHFPDLLSDAEAAAVPVNYLTAALALYRMAALAPGETVLIHNAGGGVGIAAIQLARLRRAVVLGTASATKHAALRSFGVEHIIDYRSADVAQAVREITKGRGVDVILDPIGGRSFRHQLPDAGAARPADHLRPVGRRSRRTPQPVPRLHAWLANPRFDPMSLINRNRGVFGLHVGHLWTERRQLAPIMDMLMSELGAQRHPAGGGADLPAGEGGRRAPLHPEPPEHRQGRADHVSVGEFGGRTSRSLDWDRRFRSSDWQAGSSSTRFYAKP